MGLSSGSGSAKPRSPRVGWIRWLPAYDSCLKADTTVYPERDQSLASR
jgi:hypothetical protein